MAVTRTSIFLFKRFCLIYLLNLSIYVFIFYTVMFFLVSLLFFMYLLLLRRLIPQEEYPFDRYILEKFMDVLSSRGM